MASNINYISIDETYPIAGRDNDSQGFRDNFSIIRNSFEAAKGEIEDLQLTSARLDDSNDFGGNNLVNFNMSNFTEEIFDGSSVSSTTLIEPQNGPYQFFTVNADLQFTLFGWNNTNKLTRIRVQLLSDGTSRTVTFALNGGGILKKSTRVPTTITVTSTTNPVFFDFWTINSGGTVYMDYLGSFI